MLHHSRDFDCAIPVLIQMRLILLQKNRFLLLVRVIEVLPEVPCLDDRSRRPFCLPIHHSRDFAFAIPVLIQMRLCLLEKNRFLLLVRVIEVLPEVPCLDDRSRRPFCLPIHHSRDFDCAIPVLIQMRLCLLEKNRFLLLVRVVEVLPCLGDRSHRPFCLLIHHSRDFACIIPILIQMRLSLLRKNRFYSLVGVILVLPCLGDRSYMPFCLQLLSLLASRRFLVFGLVGVRIHSVTVGTLLEFVAIDLLIVGVAVRVGTM